MLSLGLIRNTIGVILALLLVVCATAAATAQERRVALVVGNASYGHATPLKNPGNDAFDVAAALRRLGFEVDFAKDVTSDGFDNAIRSFVRRLGGADLALLYYSGHGLQFEGVNYLLPVDTRIEDSYTLKRRAVAAQDVLREMEERARASLMFLDACRNNTLARDLEASLPEAKRTVGLRGLARMEGRGNSLIAFAAAPNEVAIDGSGRNSPFTAAVLRHIDRQDTSVLDVLTAVISDVKSETRDRQRPEFVSRLTTPVRLNPQHEGERRRQELEREAAAAWPLLANSCDRGSLQEFDRLYGATSLGDRARERRADIDAKRICVVPDRPAAPPVALPAPQVVEPPAPVPAQRPAPVEPPSSEAESSVNAPLSPRPDVPPIAVSPLKPSTATDDEPLARALQTELRRLGCYEGDLDGLWGAASRSALARFLKLSKRSAVDPNSPTTELVAAARQELKPVCRQAEPVESATTQKSEKPGNETTKPSKNKPPKEQAAAVAGATRGAGQTESSGWMKIQGFTACWQVRSSCERGRKAYANVCDDRYAACIKTGCWNTNTEGHACGLNRR